MLLHCPGALSDELWLWFQPPQPLTAGCRRRWWGWCWVTTGGDVVDVPAVNAASIAFLCVRRTAICLDGFTLSRSSSICTPALPLALSVLGTAINTQPWAWSCWSMIINDLLVIDKILPIQHTCRRIFFIWFSWCHQLGGQDDHVGEQGCHISIKSKGVDFKEDFGGIRKKL